MNGVAPKPPLFGLGLAFAGVAVTVLLVGALAPHVALFVVGILSVRLTVSLGGLLAGVLGLWVTRLTWIRVVPLLVRARQRRRFRGRLWSPGGRIRLNLLRYPERATELRRARRLRLHFNLLGANPPRRPAGPPLSWRILEAFQWRFARLQRYWWPQYRTIRLKQLEERQRQHDEASRTLRRSMFGLLAFSLFSVLTLGKPDTELVLPSGGLTLPFANVEVEYSIFLVAGPIVIAGLTAYLQMFLSYFRLLDAPAKENQLPTLFNLDSATARLASSFIFYWLPPLILLVYSRKALALPVGYFTFMAFSLTTMALIFLQIRRAPHGVRQRRNPLYWLILFLLLILSLDKVLGAVAGFPLSRSVMASSSPYLQPILEGPFYSRLDLRSVDLSDHTVKGLNLAGSNLRYANLEGTRFEDCDLRFCDFSGARSKNLGFVHSDVGDAPLPDFHQGR